MLWDFPIISGGATGDRFLDKQDTMISLDSVVGDIPGIVDFGAKKL